MLIALCASMSYPPLWSLPLTLLPHPHCHLFCLPRRRCLRLCLYPRHQKLTLKVAARNPYPSSWVRNPQKKALMFAHWRLCTRFHHPI